MGLKTNLMVKPALFILLVITFISCHNPKPQPKAMVVVHGGAGYVSTDLMLPGEEDGIRDAIEKSLQKSHQHLANGGTSVETVRIAINILEDSPYFNARYKIGEIYLSTFLVFIIPIDVCVFIRGMCMLDIFSSF